MPIEKLPISSLGSLAKSNPEFKWPHRASNNRLEPVCQPRFDPSFSIDKKDKIFTIGSCFASNIAGHIKKNDLKKIKNLGYPPVAISMDTKKPYTYNWFDGVLLTSMYSKTIPSILTRNTQLWRPRTFSRVLRSL